MTKPLIDEIFRHYTLMASSKLALYSPDNHFLAYSMLLISLVVLSNILNINTNRCLNVEMNINVLLCRIMNKLDIALMFLYKSGINN